MKLITPEQRARLLANGCMRDVDHVPLVKLFNPLGLGFPLSVWTEVSRRTGSIRAAERLLQVKGSA